MEAKDTVMSREDLRSIRDRIRELSPTLSADREGEIAEATAQSQAEISFKAGIVQGKMDMLLDQLSIIAEAKQAGIEESDKKWRQILNDAITMAEMKGRKEVVEFYANHDCGLDSCDMEYQILQAQLEVWGLGGTKEVI